MCAELCVRNSTAEYKASENHSAKGHLRDNLHYLPAKQPKKLSKAFANDWQQV